MSKGQGQDKTIWSTITCVQKCTSLAKAYQLTVWWWIPRRFLKNLDKMIVGNYGMKRVLFPTVRSFHVGSDSSEMSTGPFTLTWPDPTRQISDPSPTRPADRKQYWPDLQSKIWYRFWVSEWMSEWVGSFLTAHQPLFLTVLRELTKCLTRFQEQ